MGNHGPHQLSYLARHEPSSLAFRGPLIRPESSKMRLPFCVSASEVRSLSRATCVRYFLPGWNDGPEMDRRLETINRKLERFK